ncbi:MAG: hypothetical protein PHH85_02355 [Candidatus Methanoperedens sp.]|nr:hypothetical protein [Candidatus Methanoperedens sp.]
MQATRGLKDHTLMEVPGGHVCIGCDRFFPQGCKVAEQIMGQILDPRTHGNCAM